MGAVEERAGVVSVGNPTVPLFCFVLFFSILKHPGNRQKMILHANTIMPENVPTCKILVLKKYFI